MKMAFSVAKTTQSISLGVAIPSLFNIIRNVKPQTRFQGSTFLKISCDKRLNGIVESCSQKFYCQLSESCWKCGSVINKKDLFCKDCNVLQNVDKNSNYFDILNVDQRYEVEPKELSTNFRNLQRLLHPDRFANKEEEERRISESYSSLVNKAYTTLLHPLSRGMYMLELKGVKIGEDSEKMSPDFLMDIMERNEEVDGLHDKDKIIRLTKVYQDILLKLARRALLPGRRREI
ncbi:hypothetical protein J437_LFUL016787 [Ladona fulva]|uniref:J domain-containing protein n=1 Tax=Ladona fulva TaxID=123851 RepID=A0A8K0KKZ6_LADFU|nr:hypothetical protein J437_LFUL016787 [Ladona fulva]